MRRCACRGEYVRDRLAVAVDRVGVTYRFRCARCGQFFYQRFRGRPAGARVSAGRGSREKSMDFEAQGNLFEHEEGATFDHQG